MSEFAGDYDLQYIHLHNHKGQGFKNTERGIDINHMVVEFNIYESIFSSSVTGSAVIVDTNNLIGNLPIQGTERLSFKLTSKQDNASPENSIDCSEKSGHPMHIYKLANREQINDTTQKYTLYFASREFVRNLRTRVSESFEGRMDQMVNKIFKDPDYLDSRKRLYYQKTRNQDKVVVPNLNPFDAIGLLCKRSLPDSKSDKGAGYMFYETTKGFHFRTWDNLCAGKDAEKRLPISKFEYVQVMPKNPHVDQETSKITEGYKKVENYRFINNFHDVAANTALGTYGHRVITHNIYDKSYKIDNYHYHNSFHETEHTDNNPAITSSAVDYDVVEGKAPTQKGVSDYPEARVSLWPTTQYAHGKDTGNFGTDVTLDGKVEAQRVARINQIHAGTKLEMTVMGQSWLQAGDVIQFDIQTVEDRERAPAVLDPLYSGRYIITHIRHRVVGEQYKQILTCAKDGSATSYGYPSTSYIEIAGEQQPTVASIDIT